MPALWLKVEEDILRKWYPDNGSDFCDRIIKKLLGWNRGTRNVMQKAWKLGLKYTGPRRGVFHKNQIPFNKGKKMPADIYRQCAPTMFKKGNLPHNAKETTDGCIRLRYDNRKTPVYFIRLELGKWEYLARHTWRQHHGEIPDGYIVTHKDGDSLNCDIDNLQLMSRADNARRNYSRDKFMAWHKELTDEYVLHWQRRYRNIGEIDLETARQNGLIEIWRSEIQLKRQLKSTKDGQRNQKKAQRRNG